MNWKNKLMQFNNFIDTKLLKLFKNDASLNELMLIKYKLIMLACVLAITAVISFNITKLVHNGEAGSISIPMPPDISDAVSIPSLEMMAKSDLYNSLVKSDGKRIAYLTFDDGPTNVTDKLLNVLKSENVHATFFVVGSFAEKHPNTIKREVQEGHCVANHTYSHNYKYIYSDTEGFINEVLNCEKTLNNILGMNVAPRIFRFPGGSFDNKGRMYINTIKRLGYDFIDWNTISGDAEGKRLSDEAILNNIRKGANLYEDIVVLMHDTADKEITVRTLPRIIKYLRDNGFSFEKIR